MGLKVSYVFDVSSEHNDLGEVDYFICYEGHGDYKGFNRKDENGHLIYNVEFRDKRYALQFKLMFTATVILWDESDNEEIVTIEDLLERGYVEVKLHIPQSHTENFEEWCKERDFPIVDEIKIYSGDKVPYTVYLPEDQKGLLQDILVKLTWSGHVG